MAEKNNSIDMVRGPLWGKILKFSLIYMLTTLVQHLYGAADVVIVGRYAGQNALAGVGTCTVLVNLFLNFILGLSVGATVVLGQAIGGGNTKRVGEASHTAIAVAICGGAVITIVCLLFTQPLLAMIDVPKDVIPEASVYLRVVSLGFVPSLIYNFGAAMLRAKGDTKRAFRIVLVSGLINVVLNLFFVSVLKMTAGGVALATVISQIFTAVCILYILCNETDEMRIQVKKIRIYKEPFLKILKFGLPSGIQSSVYSFSNIIVQSSVNGFGAAAIAGSSAASSITDLYSVMVNSFYQSSIVFVSQNFGARKFQRIKKTIMICGVYVVAVWAIQSVLTFFFGEFMLSIYAPGNPEVIRWGMEKFNLLGFSYGLLGLMNVMSGGLRGMGASFLNMVMSIVGACGIRIVWIFTLFREIGTFQSLFWCYPISWIGTCLMHLLMFILVYKKEKGKPVLRDLAA